MDLEPGTVVAKRYRISRPLGRGGMGEVFAAENMRTGRPVAVKLLRADTKSKSSAVMRFQREARAAGSINSDFVTQVLDVDEDPEHGIVLVFELLEGESLIDRLKRAGPMPFEELWPVIEQVWIGLGDAHKVGIIHRDLKPSNVFLERRPDGQMRVKILDFGISKVPKQMGGETLTELGQSLGTFSFMPPEQIGKAKTVDHRADIYAATTLIYQSLSGQLPYAARNVIVMVEMKSKTDPRPLAEAMGCPVDARLEAFISRGLARDPAQRFQTAQEALASWQELAPQGIPLRRSSPLAISPAPPLPAAPPADAGGGAPERAQQTPAPRASPRPDAPAAQPQAPPASAAVSPSGSTTGLSAAHRPPPQVVAGVASAGAGPVGVGAVPRPSTGPGFGAQPAQVPAPATREVTMPAREVVVQGGVAVSLVADLTTSDTALTFARRMQLPAVRPEPPDARSAAPTPVSASPVPRSPPPSSSPPGSLPPGSSPRPVPQAPTPVTGTQTAAMRMSGPMPSPLPQHGPAYAAMVPGSPSGAGNQSPSSPRPAAPSTPLPPSSGARPVSHPGTASPAPPASPLPLPPASGYPHPSSSNPPVAAAGSGSAQGVASGRPAPVRTVVMPDQTSTPHPPQGSLPPGYFAPPASVPLLPYAPPAVTRDPSRPYDETPASGPPSQDRTHVYQRGAQPAITQGGTHVIGSEEAARLRGGPRKRSVLPLVVGAIAFAIVGFGIVALVLKYLQAN